MQMEDKRENSNSRWNNHLNRQWNETGQRGRSQVADDVIKVWCVGGRHPSFLYGRRKVLALLKCDRNLAFLYGRWKVLALLKCDRNLAFRVLCCFSVLAPWFKHDFIQKKEIYDTKWVRPSTSINVYDNDLRKQYTLQNVFNNGGLFSQ